MTTWEVPLRPTVAQATKTTSHYLVMAKVSTRFLNLAWFRTAPPLALLLAFLPTSRGAFPSKPYAGHGLNIGRCSSFTL